MTTALRADATLDGRGAIQVRARQRREVVTPRTSPGAGLPQNSPAPSGFPSRVVPTP
jgi:hypothetical protein